MENDREVWWPEGRGFRRGIGIALALLFAASAFNSRSNGDWLAALISLLGVIVALFMVMDTLRRRVETDQGGLVIVGPLKATAVPWEKVADIREDAGRGGSRLVLVLRSGDIVRLPLNPTTHRALRQLWERKRS